MELDHLGFGDVRLMDGERVEFALDLKANEEGGRSGNPEVLLLTDRRVIQLNGTGRGRTAFFASIQDVDSVEIVGVRSGFGSFIWAALAFFLAAALYYMIENSLGRVLAAGALALMGVYLIASQLLEPGAALVIFKVGSSELRCGVKRDRAFPEVYAFINRLFQLKSAGDSNESPHARRFSPR